MSKYKLGKVYLLVGSSSIGTWEVSYAIKDYQAQVHTYFRTSVRDIEALTSMFDPFGDQKHVFVFKPEDAKGGGFDINFSSAYQPDENCIVFVVLDASYKSEQQRDKVKKQAQDQASEYICVCDLTKQNFLRRKEFKSWVEEQTKSDRKALEAYKKCPWRLQEIKDYRRPLIKDEEEATEEQLQDILDQLGTARGVRFMQNYSRKGAYRTFMTPERERSAAYLIMSGGPLAPRNLPKDNELNKEYALWKPVSPSLTKDKNGEVRPALGIAPELWYYFALYCDHYLDAWFSYPHLFLGYFSLWIYVCNNNFKERYRVGLKSNQAKNNASRKYYTFNPSQKAKDLFFNTIISE